ncbi:hypothetical protein PINS_up010186 [Pythium insidiosum]|nr:hypothetical protein PINS_up010186 [Pythium insidiosum]
MESVRVAPDGADAFPSGQPFDLLDEEDLESTMLVLDQSERAASTSVHKRHSSVRRASVEHLDLSLTSLAELFPSHGDMDDLTFLTEDATSPTGTTSECLSPDLKVRAPSRGSLTRPDLGTLSPTMDSFLRESWDDISQLTRRSSSKVLQSAPLISSGSARSLSKKMNELSSPTKPVPASTSRAPRVNVKRETPSRSSPKQPRRAKQCTVDGCTRRAQSNNRCKSHGGGARCQMPGCDKSSQGGGLCRAHGGGKKCRVPGCTKGTQRLGLCYLHGGIRRCIHEGCNKKDRGNGYCISHGGGRRCEVAGCNRSVRKGNHCQAHQGLEDASAFTISRGLSLHG